MKGGTLIMAVKKVDDAVKNEEENKLDDNMKLLKNLRTQHIVDINMVRVVLVLWIAAAIIACLPFFRSSYSEVERRELKKFPKFSFSALVSGDYFDEIGLWFSDTFPFRDNFVSLNTEMTNSFGKNTIQVYGEIGEADEIPDVLPPEQQQPLEPVIPEDTSSTPTPPSPSPQPQGPIVETLGGMLLVEDTAYEYYHFNQAAADNYCTTINRASLILDGKCNVYTMIVPTSMDIMLPQKYRDTVNTSNQRKAIDYMYSRISPSVKTIDVYSTLASHKDEYIYFRTDHHWTALGAYYAYCDLMQAKGVAPAELTAFKEHKFEGFLGSFYSESGRAESLGKTPDYVMAYEPTQLEYIYTYTKENPNGTNKRIVYDGNKLGQSDKYLSFLCGDKPYGIMTNPQITDGSACLVIKESFGNSMVAYLTQHYQYVHVVDYRHIMDVYQGTLRQFVEENGIQDVMFINNVSATRNNALVNGISAFVGQ